MIFKSIVFLGLFVATGVRGQNTDMTIVAKLQKKMQTHSQVTFDFVQTQFKSLRNHKRKTTGVARFAQPGLFQWKLNKPIDEWRFDGTLLYKFRPRTGSWISFDPNQGKAKELRRIVDLVLNVNALLQDYKISNIESRDKQIFATLLPKKPQEIKKVSLVFNSFLNYVQSIKMHFRGKNYTLLEFLNPDFKTFNLSEFSPPPGEKVKKASLN